MKRHSSDVLEVLRLHGNTLSSGLSSWHTANQKSKTWRFFRVSQEE